MFSEEVFDTYNDMGYYYLSNKATFDEKRNIKFMTKEALQDHYNKNPNLLMIVFVEYTDLQYIPKPFYDAVHHQMKDDRVKLILLKSNFVHHDEVLYVKFNEIDPVIRHINKV